MLNLADWNLQGFKRWRLEREATALRAEVRALCPPAAVAAEALPESVRASWVQHAQQECPGIRTDPAAWVLTSTALAQFFECCRLQTDGQACGLPSKAADVLWHVALAWQPEALESWQRQCFGQVVAHRPNAELGCPPDEAMARTWVWACRSEGRPATASGLPLLFAVDQRLHTPAGWAYAYDPKRCTVGHRDLDTHGRAQGAAHYQPALALSALAAAGLFTAAEQATATAVLEAQTHDALRRAKADANGAASGGSCGGSGTSSCGDGGAACGDGGGGASCGGGAGCGGSGCGGGS